MLRWGFWKKAGDADGGLTPTSGTAPSVAAYGEEGPDEWAFLRVQPDHDADEMASVRSQPGTGGSSRSAGDPPSRTRSLTPADKAAANRPPIASERPAPVPKLVLEIEVDGIRMIHSLSGPSVLGRRDVEAGADPDVDFDPDDSVSRRHARVVPRDGHWLLRDLGSTNGTSCNGKPVQPGTDVLLRDRDELMLGESRVLVRSTGCEPLSDEDRGLSEMLEHLGVPGVDPRQFFEDLWEPAVESAGPDLLDLALECGEEAGLIGGDRDLSRVDNRGDVTRAIAAGGKKPVAR